jgi:hypothetical protein
MRRSARNILVLALALGVVLSGGMAVAKDPTDKAASDEVTVVNLSSSEAVQTTTEFELVPIDLNGAATYAFTQEAGTALELIATAVVTHGDHTMACDMDVFVWDEATNDGLRIQRASDRGEIGWGGSEMAGLAAPVTDRQIVLSAAARESEGCDQEIEGVPQEYLDDTWTVHSLDVSVITLRN